MPRPDQTPLDPPDPTDRALSDLCRLMDGLDRLDRLFQLPDGPGGEDGEVPLGRYRVRRRLGAGRFGMVYRATDPAVGRVVVVKVPQPVVLADPELRRRFTREALAAGRLDHPGIVPVYEAGEDGGLPYLAAGLIDGPTLAGWLADRGGPPDPRVAARLVELLALAIHHAHERGVLHCDLKPANVLLDPAGPADAAVPGVGCPRVADFGLARLLEEDPSLTRTSQVAGTPLYMAPEQARGDRRALTARADVYALGAILYELLVGRPPFWGDTDAAVRLRVMTELPAPPGRRRPGVPRDLEAVCLKCLEKDPGRRYATAAELAADLERFRRGALVRARRPGAGERLSRAVRRRPATAALAVVAAAVAAVLGWVLVRDAVERIERDLALRNAERTARVERFHAGLAAVRARRMEPYSGWGSDTLGELRELAALEPAAGRLADLRSEAAAALAAIDLRPVATIGEGFRAYFPAYSPDGRTLALGGWAEGDDGVWPVRLYDAASGELLRELRVPGHPAWRARVERPDGCRVIRYSPDGRWLVAGARSGRLARWDVRNPDAGPVVWGGHVGDDVPADNHDLVALVFSADGGFLYSSIKWQVRGWDIRAGWRAAGVWHDSTAPEGTPAFGRAPIFLTGSTHSGTEFQRLGRSAKPPGRLEPRLSDYWFALSPDGRLAAAADDADEGLKLFPVCDEAAIPVPFGRAGHPRADEGRMYEMAFSPDAARLVTTGEFDRRVKVWDVAAASLASGRVVGGGSVRFAFAPDGRRLAVAEEGRTVVYEVTGRVRETLAVGPQVQLRSFAAGRDGRTLTTFHYDARLVKAERVTRSVPPDGPVRVTDRHEVYPPAEGVADAAPDGRTYAFACRNEIGKQVVAVSTGWHVPAEDVADVRFGPDGRLWVADAHRIRVLSPGTQTEETALTNDPEGQDAGMVFRAVAPGPAHPGRPQGRASVLARRAGRAGRDLATAEVVRDRAGPVVRREPGGGRKRERRGGAAEPARRRGDPHPGRAPGRRPVGGIRPRRVGGHRVGRRDGENLVPGRNAGPDPVGERPGSAGGGERRRGATDRLGRRGAGGPPVAAGQVARRTGRPGPRLGRLKGVAAIDRHFDPIRVTLGSHSRRSALRTPA
jgi:WD40 repeat protein